MYKNFKRNNHNFSFDKDALTRYKAKNIAKTLINIFDKTIKNN